jgi:hypothetical protein
MSHDDELVEAMIHDATPFPNLTGRKAKPKMKSVLQDWVMELPLRHQGTLLTCVRGCDTAPKNDPSKLLARPYRATILNAFVGDPKKAQTFIEAVEPDVLLERMTAYRKNLDHYPHHYIMHVIHASAIVGYKHPDSGTRKAWLDFYHALCRGLHMNPETEKQLDERLTRDEHEFGRANRE